LARAKKFGGAEGRPETFFTLAIFGFWQKPIFVTKILEKTPEYSGVFLAEPEKNIGFSCFRFDCEQSSDTKVSSYPYKKIQDS